MQTFWDWTKRLFIVVVISCLGYALQFLASSYIQPTSRRMANITFVFWIVGLSAQVLWSCLSVDLISTAITALVYADCKKVDFLSKESHLLAVPSLRSSVPCLLNAVNANGLFFFMLANVFTGVINMAIPTIDVPDPIAVFILLIYTFMLSYIIVKMDLNDISTKFW